MNKTAIYHKASEQFAYAQNKDELIINIKTGYDVKRVIIYYGDPYEVGIMGGKEKWIGVGEEICFKKRLNNQIWWTTTLKPVYHRMKYYFELQTGIETWYYFEDGLFTKEQMDREGKVLQYFIIPWMNPSDINITPSWVNETVWYQIFPERFCNGNKNRNPKDVKEWQTGSVTNEEFYGGDLEGILSKLDYLEKLGINGIYLTPIFESNSTHKYDTKDYTKIDPSFGDNETMRKLVSEAHKRKIRVMIDAVFNHVGVEFEPWKDVCKNGTSSIYFDWFMIHKWPIKENLVTTKEESYDSFAFCPGMPKLNTNNKAVMEYLISICEGWIREFQIDGIRFDVGNEVSHTFLKKLRAAVKLLNPDIYLLGEIWHNAMPWLLGDEYDAVMNYPLSSAIQDFWIEHLTKESFESSINRCYTMYMQQTNQVLFNLLDSHDTPRLIHITKNIDIFYQQLVILYTMPGSPCIFYGTEVAMDGSHDPDCRRCMPWTEIEEGVFDSSIMCVKQLINLRKTEEAFKSCHFHFPNCYENSRVIEYIKLTNKGDKIEVLLNCSDKSIELLEEKNIIFSRLYGNKNLEKNGILISKIDEIK